MGKPQMLYLKMPKNMRHIKKNFWDENEIKKLLRELPFYKTFI